MAKSVFVIDADNALTELKQSDYDSEDLLQRLLADHPALLSSATGADGGLLLVRREAPVPDTSGGPGRWSLDHLFLDRNGVPVLVEVKRATDTRARREVVAQMLDYAANGVAYWPPESLISAFQSTATESGRNADEVLSAFLGADDPELFWRSVDANLKAGRIRMIFLADAIGKELQRIVEFLNEQMRPAEVLAVEVVQYVSGNGIRTLVPQLVGATARAEATKTLSTPKSPIGEEEWLATLAAQKGEGAKLGAEKVLAWLRSHGASIGVSDSHDSISASFPTSGGQTVYPMFARRSTGNFEVSLSYLKKAPAFASEDSRLRLLERMRVEVPRIKIWSTKATSWPNLPLEALLDEDVWDALSGVLSDVISGINEDRED
jgi:hypothetical protein